MFSNHQQPANELLKRMRRACAEAMNDDHPLLEKLIHHEELLAAESLGLLQNLFEENLAVVHKAVGNE